MFLTKEALKERLNQVPQWVKDISLTEGQPNEEAEQGRI